MLVCVNAATLFRAAASGMLAVGWLTGRRGWVMQVLQCGVLEEIVEGRG